MTSARTASRQHSRAVAWAVFAITLLSSMSSRAQSGADGGETVPVPTLSGSSATPNDDFPSVGISRQINDLILPGSELTTKPIDDASPIILRIVDTRVHGTAFRYDLVYYGLEPGDFDLRDFLARIDGGSTEDLPRIPVKILGVLPAGQVVPNDLEQLDGPRLGGYRLTLWIFGLIWLLGLLALIFWPRSKSEQSLAEQSKPITLADRLRPMVESAVQGKLSAGEKAELERLLLAYWHDKLEVGGLPPSQAIRKMREDKTAGQLITALEEWLHSPEPVTSADVNKLLEPYSSLGDHSRDIRQTP